jgi:hypothetical protein
MRTTGNSIIAFGVFAFVAHWMAGTLDLGPALLICFGAVVRIGGPKATFWAIVLSILHAVAAVAAVPMVLLNEITDVGLWHFALTEALGMWAIVNLILLCRVRNSLAAARREGRNGPPDPKAALPPFQFTVRTALIATAIVALGCAMGSRRLPPDDHWDGCQVYTLTGKMGLQSHGVIGYRSGRPVAGYLWREKGNGEVRSPTRVRIANRANAVELIVDGKAIEPTAEFQLFVNDLRGDPIRLIVPKEQALGVFARPTNPATLDKFWNEFVEPARKTQLQPLGEGG